MSASAVMLCLAQKYVVNALDFAVAIALLHLVFVDPRSNSVPAALFWGSVLVCPCRRFRVLPIVNAASKVRCAISNKTVFC